MEFWKHSPNTEYESAYELIAKTAHAVYTAQRH
jgi:hypothetical protein